MLEQQKQTNPHGVLRPQPGEGPILEIRDLCVRIDGNEILSGVNLNIRGGEIHVLMGPNGTGKSTLASVIMGNPAYKEISGSIRLNGRELLGLPADERARMGLFLAMQYPSEISGITNADFLRAAVNARRPKDKPIGVFPFRRILNEALDRLEMSGDMPSRYLNEGFSGGEKKRNEILQMLLLKPQMALLDEIDSGLDIDALRIVGENVTRLAREESGRMGLLVITHYQRLLDYIPPDYVHVLMDGRIVRDGGPELAKRLEKEGYDWLRQELSPDPGNPQSAATPEVQAQKAPAPGNSAQPASGETSRTGSDTAAKTEESEGIRPVRLAKHDDVQKAAIKELLNEPAKTFTVEDAFALKASAAKRGKRSGRTNSGATGKTDSGAEDLNLLI